MTQILCIMGIFYKYAYVFCASIFFQLRQAMYFALLCCRK